jgi:hypothetical protein
LSLPINLTDNNCKTNRFYRLNQKSLAKNDGAGFMTNSASAIVNSVGSTRQDFEAKQDTARRYLMIASGLPPRSALPCKLERPEDYSAASCSEQPSTAIPRGV